MGGVSADGKQLWLSRPLRQRGLRDRHHHGRVTRSRSEPNRTASPCGPSPGATRSATPGTCDEQGARTPPPVLASWLSAPPLSPCSSPPLLPRSRTPSSRARTRPRTPSTRRQRPRGQSRCISASRSASSSAASALYDARGRLIDSAHRRTLTVTAPPSRPRCPPRAGTYVVTWRVISADTHPVSGAFTFSVGTKRDVQQADDTPALRQGGDSRRRGHLRTRPVRDSTRRCSC